MVFRSSRETGADIFGERFVLEFLAEEGRVKFASVRFFERLHSLHCS